MTKPVGGTVLKSLRRCWVFVMASWTFFRVVSDFMLDAVPYSFLSIAMTSLICLPGGTYRETSSVPLPSLEARVWSDLFKRNRSRELLF